MAKAGASVRRIAAELGLSRSAAHGLVQWASVLGIAPEPTPEHEAPTVVPEGEPTIAPDPELMRRWGLT
jgi:hypothetical protein